MFVCKVVQNLKLQFPFRWCSPLWSLAFLDHFFWRMNSTFSIERITCKQVWRKNKTCRCHLKEERRAHIHTPKSLQTGKLQAEMWTLRAEWAHETDNKLKITASNTVCVCFVFQERQQQQQDCNGGSFTFFCFTSVRLLPPVPPMVKPSPPPPPPPPIAIASNYPTVSRPLPSSFPCWPSLDLLFFCVVWAEVWA